MSKNRTVAIASYVIIGLVLVGAGLVWWAEKDMQAELEQQAMESMRQEQQAAEYRRQQQREESKRRYAVKHVVPKGRIVKPMVPLPGAEQVKTLYSRVELERADITITAKLSPALTRVGARFASDMLPITAYADCGLTPESGALTVDVYCWRSRTEEVAEEAARVFFQVLPRHTRVRVWVAWRGDTGWQADGGEIFGPYTYDKTALGM